MRRLLQETRDLARDFDIRKIVNRSHIFRFRTEITDTSENTGNSVEENTRARIEARDESLGMIQARCVMQETHGHDSLPVLLKTDESVGDYQNLTSEYDQQQ